MGDIPWGTHFCQFYETTEDLLELLIPFHKAGLENNEYCLCAVFGPLTTDDIIAGLQKAVPDLQHYLEKKSINVVDYTTLFFKDGRFDEKVAYNNFTQRLKNALAKGYDGMRVNGNEAWLKSQEWDSFMKYENRLTELTRDLPFIILCTYPLSESSGGTLLDVAHAHDAVVAKRKGQWEILEQPKIKKLKSQLQSENDELERRVSERTAELGKLVGQLQKEIEKREKAQEQIRQQAELTNEIIDAIPTMAWSILPNGKLDFVNQRWLQYTGVPFDDAMKDPTGTVHPEDLPRAMQKWKENSARNTAYDDEMPLKRADGQYCWFLVRTAPLRDEQGNVCKWYGVSIEIDERKKIEEELRQSESLLIEAEHLAHVGSWSLDLLTKTVTWSHELYQIFGVSPLAFDKKLETVIGFSHPEDKDFIAHVVEEAIATHKPNDFHYRMIRPDGKERTLHVSLAVTTDEHDNPVRIFGAVQDVTDRKKGEDDLRQAYQRLSYHVQNTPLAVIEWDKDLNITRWSDQAEKIFGWKASEVMGKHRYDPDFPIVYKEDQEQVAKADHDLTNGLVDRNVSLNRNYTKDGKVIYCEWYNSVLKDDQGNVVTILSLTHDVTERKQAEKKLPASYEQIRSLSEHLTNIREEERKYIAREIHDELGQQLTVLKMDVGSIVKKIQLTDDVMRNRLASLSTRIDSIIQSVRTISSELRPSLLDDFGLPSAIAWHLEQIQKRSGIKTHFHEPNDEWNLADPIKTNLFRLLQEALTNIVRHSKATDVKVSLDRNDHSITLSIIDNGIGFNATNVDRGNTLGIVGMRERAGIIGGKLEINTVPGNGTNILVTVPVE